MKPRRTVSWKHVAAAGALAVSQMWATSAARGATIVSYNFATNASPDSAVAGGTGSDVTPGSSTSVAVSIAKLGTTGWTTAGSIDLNDYVQFTVTPSAGFALSVTGLNFSSDRDQAGPSGTGPTAGAIRNSTNSYGSNSATFTPAGKNAQAVTTNFVLSNLTTATTFRIYAWGNNGNASTLWDLDAISLLGEMTALAKMNVAGVPSRVIVGTSSVNLNIGNSATGGTAQQALTYAMNVTGNLTGSGSSAGLAAGSSNNISLAIASPGTAGTKTATVNLTAGNAYNVTAPGGVTTLGPTGSISIATDVVNNRTITGTNVVDLGRVVVGATSGAKAVTLSSTAARSITADVQLNGGTYNTTAGVTSGTVTLGSGSAYTFNGTNTETVRNLTATFTTAGTRTETANFAGNTAGMFTGETGLAGQTLQALGVQYTATAVNNRAITQGSTANLGGVFVSSSTGALSTSLDSTGLHNVTADVTVNGGVFNQDGGTLTVGNGEFTGAAGNENLPVSLEASFTAAGSKSGTLTLTSAGGHLSGEAGLVGQTVAPVLINYTAAAYDHASLTASAAGTIRVTEGQSASTQITLTNAGGSALRDAALISDIAINGGFATDFSGPVEVGADSSDTSFTAFFSAASQAAVNAGLSKNLSVTYGDKNVGFSGANIDNQTADLALTAVVDKLAEHVSTSSGMAAQGRSSLGTLQPIKIGPESYFAGELLNINGGAGASKGYVTIDLQPVSESFSPDAAVVLIDFSSTADLNSLTADLQEFGYEFATSGGSLTGNYATYDLQITLGTAALNQSYFGFDFTKYSSLNAVNIAVVPEPSTLGLVGVGAAGLLLRRRRR